jgi:hypothetical protein
MSPLNGSNSIMTIITYGIDLAHCLLNHNIPKLHFT